MAPSFPPQENHLLRELAHDGGLRPAPLMLARTVKNRIRILTAIHRENRHFRVLSGFILLVLVTFLAGGVLLSENEMLREGLSRYLPGGMGYFDYLIASTNQTVLAIGAALMLLASLLLALQQSVGGNRRKNISKQM